MSAVPNIGLGTWQNSDPDECIESVEYALDLGYRHVDTAQFYDNEEFVGRGIDLSDVYREDFWLATKVWVDNLGYDDVIESTADSIGRLGVDYLDILYVHWPAGEYDPEGTLPAFDQLRSDGKIRNVGVSNFTPGQVEEAMEVADSDILVNQIEMHPLLQQEEMVEFAQENDLEIVAYSPLARGTVIDVPELQEIGEKHDCSPAQVSLAWLMGIDNVHPVPKSANKSHIRENFMSMEVELDDEDVGKIEGIEEKNRLIEPEKLAPW
ncbi:MAG: aldo/keto reductase [Halobacteria archaeon]